MFPRRLPLLWAVLLLAACGGHTARAPELAPIIVTPPAEELQDATIGCYRFAFRHAADSARVARFPTALELTGIQDVPVDSPERVYFPRVRVPSGTPLVHGDTLYWLPASDSVIVARQWASGSAFLATRWQPDSTLRGRLLISDSRHQSAAGEWQATGRRVDCAELHVSAP